MATVIGHTLKLCASGLDEDFVSFQAIKNGQFTPAASEAATAADQGYCTGLPAEVLQGALDPTSNFGILVVAQATQSL